MASRRYVWNVVDGPVEWPLTQSFWSGGIHGKTVRFRLNRSGALHIHFWLQMEIWVMGRGPSPQHGLFFSGPATLFSPDFSKHWEVGKTKINNYNITDNSGEAVFKADID